MQTIRALFRWVRASHSDYARAGLATRTTRGRIQAHTFKLASFCEGSRIEIINICAGSSAGEWAVWFLSKESRWNWTNRRWDISSPAARPEYIQTTSYILHIVHDIFPQIAFFFVTSRLRVVQWRLAQQSESQIAYVAWLQNFRLTGSRLWLRVGSESELQQH